jgi:hypothetical protein
MVYQEVRQRPATLNHPITHDLKTMPIDLPYAADAEVSLSYDELAVRPSPYRLGHVGLTDSSCNQVLQIQYAKEQELGHISSQTKFNYAWGLVKSPNKEQQVEGVGLLQGMFPTSLWCNRNSGSDLICGIRFVPFRPISAERMPLLSGAWLLQVAQLRTGTEVQWYVYIPWFLCALSSRSWFPFPANALHFCHYRTFDSKGTKQPASPKPWDPYRQGSCKGYVFSSYHPVFRS